jgi:hypothetical protein
MCIDELICLLDNQWRQFLWRQYSPVQNAEPDSREYEYQGYSRQNDDRQYLLFPFHIYLMYASVKNYNIQKYEKAGDDEGDLLPFLNNPFSAHSVLPFEDWVVV